MKSLLKVVVMSFLAVVLATSLFAATNPIHHGKSLKGTITAVDDANKTFTVKTSAGKTFDLMWNGATKVTGGSPKVGEQVTARYMVKDGKNVATSASVSTMSSAKK